MAIMLISFEVQGVKDGQQVDVGDDPKVFKSEHNAYQSQSENESRPNKGRGALPNW